MRWGVAGLAKKAWRILWVTKMAKRRIADTVHCPFVYLLEGFSSSFLKKRWPVASDLQKSSFLLVICFFSTSYSSFSQNCVKPNVHDFRWKKVSETLWDEVLMILYSF
jgi:hypothetical protein